MRRVLSIASLTFRAAARSRLAAVLALAMVLIVAGLPALLRGDGTPDGFAKMALLYVLGAADAVLAIALLCASAGGIANDIRDGTMQLLRVKPVRMAQLWLGKWLGLVALGGLLLTLAFAGVWLRIALADRAAGAVADHAASLAVPPALPPLEDHFRAVLEANTRERDLSPAEIRALRSEIRAKLPYATAALQEGGTWKWTFDLPRPVAADGRLALRLRFETGSYSRRSPTADCALTDPATGASVPFRLADFSLREFTVPVDAPALAGAKKLVLSIRHTGEAGSGAILLQPRQGLHLLLPAGPLGLNLARAFAIELALLALLVALGLSFSALFSLPVAVFCAIGLLLAVAVSDFAAHDPDALDTDGMAKLPPVARVYRSASLATVKALSFLSAPALRAAPLSQLSDSEWVPGRDVARAVGVNALLLPALLCGLSALALRRKELPL